MEPIVKGEVLQRTINNNIVTFTETLAPEDQGHRKVERGGGVGRGLAVGPILGVGAGLGVVVGVAV